MSDANTNQEPSMEEILTSIRKIISEDGEASEGQAKKATAGTATETEPLELVEEMELNLVDEVGKDEPEALDLDVLDLVEESDVLDLVEGIEEEPLELVDGMDDLDEIELVDDYNDFEDELPPPPPPPPPSPPPPPPSAPSPSVAMVAEVADSKDERVLQDIIPHDSPVAEVTDSKDERVVSDSTVAFGSASFAQLEHTIRMGHAGETLEDIVKSLLQPMLREWLDENLPRIVEGLVQEEIRKMAGAGKHTQD